MKEGLEGEGVEGEMLEGRGRGCGVRGCEGGVGERGGCGCWLVCLM